MESTSPHRETVPEGDKGLAVAMATLPGNFSEVQVASGILSPTAMAFAPDGRLFVCEQRGKLRVIKNGSLLATPFLSLGVDAQGERGLLGVAFDPDFANTRQVYVYYTATSPNPHNRLSRFTATVANPDVADMSSERIILDLNPLSNATNHNGGALHFAPDGKLFIGVGENANGSNSQSMGNLLGKMLRINRDGSIPTDNPFYNSATGNNRAIWALGLRNPFTFAFQPGTGRIFINDVGQNHWEEIDDGVAGANYGWPTTEGSTSDSRFKTPFHSYGHASGCAITGGAFYNPAAPQYPSDYLGDYFFADYCRGWIRKLDIQTGTVTDFATGAGAPTDLAVGPDGNLYYLAGSGGIVRKIVYSASAQAPTISVHPAGVSISAGQAASFTVTANGTGPLTYQWRRNNVDISGATASAYSLATTTSSDSGARFRVLVSNAYGSALSNEAVLSVSSNRPPVPALLTPTEGSLFQGGQVIEFSGSASDPEDGNLAGSCFTWQVDLHHADHVHPFLGATTGSTSGSITVPTRGETASNIWYRIHLTVRDAGGLTSHIQRDILPRTATITLQTVPAGLSLKLDGQPSTAPINFTGVAGVIRALEAVTPQESGGKSWEFVSWSDGGTALHEISTPGSTANYTATFREIQPPPSQPGIYEAESALLSGPKVASSATGFTGTGYVIFMNANVDFVEWIITVPVAGRYHMDVRYALEGTAISSLQFNVNGVTERYSMDYRPTGSNSTWSTVRHSSELKPGTNKIRVVAVGTFGPNIDHLSVTQ